MHTITLNIEASLLQELQALAHSSGKSLDHHASMALQQYIDAQNWRRDAIQHAKAEAQKGDFISQEAMLAWANALD